MGIILSIIVPVYKVESYLEDCIQSILKQSFKNLELILVDDGSPDNCGNICDNYAKQDSRIKVIHQQNAGLSGARNSGIRIAKGEYITFIDSDDKIQEDTLLKNMSILLADKSIELLEYPIYVYYGSDKQYIWKDKSQHNYETENIFINWIENGGYDHSYAWNKIYKRGLFENLQFPIEKFFEDVYTIPLLLKKVNHLYISDEGLYYYYWRGNSISVISSYYKKKDFLEANLNIWQSLTNYSISKKGLLTYYLYISNIVIDLFEYEQKDVTYKEYVIKELSSVSFELNDLWKLNVSKRVKYKNITLVAMGIRTHCKIYNFLHKFTRHLCI